MHEGFQLSRESERKKSEEAQTETNDSQKHGTPVLVRTRKERNKCKIIAVHKTLNVNNWYAAVRKQLLCCICLGKVYAFKDCQVNLCVINRCNQTNNQLPHSEN